ncbi:uncharacterized protein LOC116338996 [Contarinia nasturtii]|uniref:uncharacterized protein LOC116338996 n=1 Tax=Contarinia nasturtii TaxID=265458 RepID=UPI0012D3EBAC|nr:uncharacterized protein LOC116338996 [Contarinia nasturtii]
MVYDGWSFEVQMLIADEWYLWDDFVHFVKYRLGQLSFTYDRRSIRQHLDLPRSLRQIHQPFRNDVRFPANQILINTSFEIDLCIRRILSGNFNTSSTGSKQQPEQVESLSGHFEAHDVS